MSTETRSFEEHKPHHAPHHHQTAPQLQSLTLNKVVRLIQVFTALCASISMYIYINDLDAWSKRNAFYLLISITSLFFNTLFFGLLFRKSQSRLGFAFPIVFDLLLGISVFVGTILVTAMYGDFNYYGFCSARVFVYSYNYYINCRALMTGIIFGFLSTVMFLVAILVGAKSTIGVKKA